MKNGDDLEEQEEINSSVIDKRTEADPTQHRYGNVTTAQFIALAEDDSGMDLQHFFDVWLYQPDKPTSW